MSSSTKTSCAAKKIPISRLSQLSTPKHRKNVGGATSFAHIAMLAKAGPSSGPSNGLTLRETSLSNASSGEGRQTIPSDDTATALQLGSCSQPTSNNDKTANHVTQKRYRPTAGRKKLWRLPENFSRTMKNDLIQTDGVDSHACSGFATNLKEAISQSKRGNIQRAVPGAPENTTHIKNDDGGTGPSCSDGQASVTKHTSRVQRQQATWRHLAVPKHRPRIVRTYDRFSRTTIVGGTVQRKCQSTPKSAGLAPPTVSASSRISEQGTGRRILTADNKSEGQCASGQCETTHAIARSSNEPTTTGDTGLGAMNNDRCDQGVNAVKGHKGRDAGVLVGDKGVRRKQQRMQIARGATETARVVGGSGVSRVKNPVKYGGRVGTNSGVVSIRMRKEENVVSGVKAPATSKLTGKRACEAIGQEIGAPISAGVVRGEDGVAVKGCGAETNNLDHVISDSDICCSAVKDSSNLSIASEAPSSSRGSKPGQTNARIGGGQVRYRHQPSKGLPGPGLREMGNSKTDESSVSACPQPKSKNTATSRSGEYPANGGSSLSGFIECSSSTRTDAVARYESSEVLDDGCPPITSSDCSTSMKLPMNRSQEGGAMLKGDSSACASTPDTDNSSVTTAVANAASSVRSRMGGVTPHAIASTTYDTTVNGSHSQAAASNGYVQGFRPSSATAVEGGSSESKNNVEDFEPISNMRDPTAPWNIKRPHSSPLQRNASTLTNNADSASIAQSTHKCIDLGQNVQVDADTPDTAGIDEKQSAAAVQLRNAKRRFRQSSQLAQTRKWPLRINFSPLNTRLQHHQQEDSRSSAAGHSNKVSTPSSPPRVVPSHSSPKVTPTPSRDSDDGVSDIGDEMYR
eukprot:CAMPEP_0185038584 /NCGR_PEP_ID=MMETSP1103-20130426/34413_1 /TAXON_ID=36769 /ORGANISM="Paraphysomonas bandaiensis, Strain Caron Lab Isolate" /LENGTH=857 /DNA_ID=CAMNT_0027577077 /DNA_START=82 /DNA_END=2654 /DNA_ORIENTATION=-